MWSMTPTSESGTDEEPTREGRRLVLDPDGGVRWADEETPLADSRTAAPEANHQHTREWGCGVEQVREGKWAPYEAAVPAVTAHLAVPPLGPTAVAAQQAAWTATAAFGDVEAWSDIAPGLLSLREAAASSRLEGIRPTWTEIMRERHGRERGVRVRDEPAALVLDNLAATTALCASSALDDLADFGVLSAHETLLGRSAQAIAGVWRPGPVWIGHWGSSPRTARFVPPVASRVEPAMSDFVEFVRRADLPLLTHAAIAHAQFETIHPFGDGNGRLGRSLVVALLGHAGLGSVDQQFPISTGLDRRDYIEALTAYRRGEVASIVDCFAAAMSSTVAIALDLTGALDDLHHQWRWRLGDGRHATPRADAAVWRLLPLLAANAVVSVGWLADRLSISYPAAQRAVEQAEAAEIIEPDGAPRARHRAWVSTEVIELLEGLRTPG